MLLAGLVYSKLAPLDMLPFYMILHDFTMLPASMVNEVRWNVANIFTGWVDVDLSEKGLGEAKGAGELLKARMA